LQTESIVGNQIKDTRESDPNSFINFNQELTKEQQQKLDMMIEEYENSIRKEGLWCPNSDREDNENDMDEYKDEVHDMRDNNGEFALRIKVNALDRWLNDPERLMSISERSESSVSHATIISYLTKKGFLGPFNRRLSNLSGSSFKSSVVNSRRTSKLSSESGKRSVDDLELIENIFHTSMNNSTDQAEFTKKLHSLRKEFIHN